MRPTRSVLASCGGALLAAAVTLLTSAPARADVLFMGAGVNGENGDNVSGTASFAVSGNTLTLVLANTSAPTSNNGSVLTGVLFDVAGMNPTLTLGNITLTAGSSLFTSNSTTNNAAPLNGSYTTVFGATPPSAEFGLACTGFGGAFNAGTITLGTGGADYGLIAPGTFPSGAPNPNQFPLSQNSLTFALTIGGSLSEANITNVRLLFGTSGQGIIPAQAIPEPATLALCGPAALLGLAGWRWRRRRPAA